MTRLLAVAALSASIIIAMFAAAAVPQAAVAGSLSLRISPTELSPLQSATISGKISPKLKKPGKLIVQLSADNKHFTTLRTVNLPKGATNYATRFTAGTVLGPVFLRSRLGQLATKGLKIMVAETVGVQIDGLAFSPQVLTVKPWTPVVWTNNDSVSHTVTAVDSLDLNATPTGLFNGEPAANGGSFQHLFTRPGTYYYECTIHRGLAAMHAAVIVK